MPQCGCACGGGGDVCSVGSTAQQRTWVGVYQHMWLPQRGLPAQAVAPHTRSCAGGWHRTCSMQRSAAACGVSPGGAPTTAHVCACARRTACAPANLCGRGRRQRQWPRRHTCSGEAACRGHGGLSARCVSVCACRWVGHWLLMQQLLQARLDDRMTAANQSINQPGGHESNQLSNTFSCCY